MDASSIKRRPLIPGDKRREQWNKLRSLRRALKYRSIGSHVYGLPVNLEWKEGPQPFMEVFTRFDVPNILVVIEGNQFVWTSSDGSVVSVPESEIVGAVEAIIATRNTL